MAYINIVTQSEPHDFSHNHNQKLVGKYFLKIFDFFGFVFFLCTRICMLSRGKC